MDAAVVRGLLARNEALQAQADASTLKIREAAEAQLRDINDRLDNMPQGLVVRDAAKAHEYRRLIDERGRLQRVIAAG